MKARKIRTPGNRNAAQKMSRKTSTLTCSNCGAILHGMRRMATARFVNANISQKRVGRMFGGNMCSACSRENLRSRARSV